MRTYVLPPQEPQKVQLTQSLYIPDCKKLAPVYEELADAFAAHGDKVTIAKVDADSTFSLFFFHKLTSLICCRSQVFGKEIRHSGLPDYKMV